MHLLCIGCGLSTVNLRNNKMWSLLSRSWKLRTLGPVSGWLPAGWDLQWLLRALPVQYKLICLLLIYVIREGEPNHDLTDNQTACGWPWPRNALPICAHLGHSHPYFGADATNTLHLTGICGLWSFVLLHLALFYNGFKEVHKRKYTIKNVWIWMPMKTEYEGWDVADTFPASLTSAHPFPVSPQRPWTVGGDRGPCRCGLRRRQQCALANSEPLVLHQLWTGGLQALEANELLL